MWAADTIAPAGMTILCIALRYDNPENHKKYPIYYVSLIKLELWFDFDYALYEVYIGTI